MNRAVPLPLVFVALAFIIGLMRFDFARPSLGLAFALLLPAFAAYRSFAKVSETDGRLRSVGVAAALLSLVVAESCVASALFQPTWPRTWPGLQGLSGALLAFGFGLSLYLERLAALRGLRVRSAGWLGLSGVFAYYLSGHFSRQDPFGSTFGAFYVALFGGGGCGLLLGELVYRASTRNPAK